MILKKLCIIIRVGTIGSRVLSGDGGDWHVTEVTSSSDQPCRDLQAVEDYLSNLEIEKPLWEEPLVVNGGDVILTLERPGGETKRISFSLDGTACTWQMPRIPPFGPNTCRSRRWI